MKDMAQDIMAALAPLVQQGKVRVLETSRGVTIEIADSALFSVGQPFWVWNRRMPSVPLPKSSPARIFR